jgi:trans-2,3-dihydro-3-hydroxyanthranilate isomerase
MKAGVIPVAAAGDNWTLRANAPRSRKSEASRAELATALGIGPEDIVADPLWVNTGSEQLVIPLRDADAVDRCQPEASQLSRHGHNGERAMAYVWAQTGNDQAQVRFFFPKYGGLCEDPGTGSACANLGGYLLATGHPTPLRWTLRQGEHVGRPCLLKLGVSSDGAIEVGGRVIELGRGTVTLP